MQRKAFLAIAFAAGLVNYQLPALSQNSPESKDSVIEVISCNTQMTPEVRAYSLLNLSRQYLTGHNIAKVETGWASEVLRINHARNWQDILTSWADQFSSQNGAIPQSGAVPAENILLADRAILKAVALADQGTDKFAKTLIYFVASRLFAQVGDLDGVRNCDKFLEDTFRNCETHSTDEQEIKASSTVLVSMAYGLIPVNISDYPQGSLEPQVEPYTETEFEASNKLRVRGIKMVDRLPATNHVRRKAHRDLALWYLKLGKTEMAEKEKQILFALVGCNDDDILYPQAGGCGHLIWWETKKVSGVLACGMG